MYQLLIVCPQAFRSVCESYARFKRSTGITCLVHPYEGSAERMRDLPFLQELGVRPEQLTEPASCLKVDIARHFLATGTRYVILAGDVDKVPVPWFEFKQDGSRYFYPTDLYYADLFKRKPGAVAYDSWDPDRDSVKGEFAASQISAIDWIPDLAVGRIPASSADELEHSFARLMTRPARPPRSVVLQGNDPNGNTPWLQQVSNEAANMLKSRGYSVTKFSIAPDAGAGTAQNTLESLYAKLAGGVEYLFWFGHGGKNCWASFGPYTLYFPDLIPKIKGSPVVFSMSCDVGSYSEGVYGSRYFAHGVLTSPVALGSAQSPLVPDAVQPVPSTLEQDFAPEEWLVKHDVGATALIAGHSWGSLGTDYLKTQPLEFIRRLPSNAMQPAYLGRAYNSMIMAYLARYRQKLPTDGTALNHLLRIHLFGDPTAPLFC